MIIPICKLKYDIFYLKSHRSTANSSKSILSKVEAIMTNCIAWVKVVCVHTTLVFKCYFGSFFNSKICSLTFLLSNLEWKKSVTQQIQTIDTGTNTWLKCTCLFSPFWCLCMKPITKAKDDDYSHKVQTEQCLWKNIISGVNFINTICTAQTHFCSMSSFWEAFMSRKRLA